MDAAKSTAVPPDGTPVDVYRNLHRPGRVWSVRDRRSGRVVAHVECLELTDVTFVVQPAGAAAARRDRVRNVHAFIRGTVATGAAPPGCWTGITYDPFDTAGFVTTDDGREVTRAERAAVSADGAFAVDPD